jgi:hypothetical protein
MGVTQRRVRLLVSPRVDAPAVLGWLRPVILAPVAALSGLSPDHIEALLAHELAHIRRNDYLINLLQSVVETLLFYHPAVWWISRQIRTERELCCDDLAVALTTDVLTYAQALAELEAGRPSRLRTAVAGTDGSLSRRIARLLEPTTMHHKLPRPAAAWALSALLAAGITLLALRTPAKAQEYPTISRNTVWVDTVKRGDLAIRVRGLGTLVSPNLAEIQIAETQIREVRPGQAARIDLHKSQSPVSGQVTRVHSESHNGTITVDVATQGIPPDLGRPPLAIDASIQIRTVPNLVVVGRPVFGQADTEGTLFRLDPDGQHAVRVKVMYGQSSINQIEIRSGLIPGDKVILSDLSAYSGNERINLR